MSKAKFTKGPWEKGGTPRSDNGGDKFYVYQIDSSTGAAICNTNMAYSFVEPNEREANAHLISAAPDMYEALKSCQEYFRGYEPY